MIALYWGGALLSWWSKPLADFYGSVPASYFNILFFPPLALAVLSIRYVRVLFERGDWVADDTMTPLLYEKRSIGGYRDPTADPLDPRSGSLYRRHRHWQITGKL